MLKVDNFSCISNFVKSYLENSRADLAWLVNLISNMSCAYLFVIGSHVVLLSFETELCHEW